MTSRPVPLYWDSCVHIDCIQEHRPHYDDISGILEDARSGKVLIVASTLVLAEVVKLRQSQEPLEQQAELIREFMEND